METPPTPTGTTEPQIATAEAVACSDLVAGESVSWTHVRHRGRSIDMTRREGTVIGVYEGKAECWRVKHRSKELIIHRSHLRRIKEPSTLDEMLNIGRKPATVKGEPR